MKGFDPDYTEMSVMKTNENLANIFECFNFSMYIQYIQRKNVKDRWKYGKLHTIILPSLQKKPYIVFLKPKL